MIGKYHYLLPGYRYRRTVLIRLLLYEYKLLLKQ